MPQHKAYANQVSGRGWGKNARLKEEVARQHLMVEHQREMAKQNREAYQRMYSHTIHMEQAKNDVLDKLNSIIDALSDCYSPKPDVYTFDREELNELLGINPDTNKPQIIEVNDCGTNPKYYFELEAVQMLWLNQYAQKLGETGVFYTCLDHYHYATEA